ncbi:MAG: DUF4157 domain-containing protein [Desulfobulbaceae bacterium]|nr:DUF4157 domain-containing protein [Pseudomonadota bacterium]MCG2746991.1 DUF4157 domain-containing protein [Desulfobulbaceae bacterium]
MRTVITRKKEQSQTESTLQKKRNNLVDLKKETGENVGMPVFLQRQALYSAVSMQPVQRQPVEEEEDEDSSAPDSQVQAQLTVGAPDDEYEREADQVADTVMRMPDSHVAQTFDDDDDDEEEISGKSEVVQTKPITPLYVQRICPECDEELLQQPESPSSGTPAVQTKSTVEGSLTSNHQVAKAIRSPGGGSPLPKHIQAKAVRVLGNNLHFVQVHNDSQAHYAARSINAKAFTHKNDIFLGEGQSTNDLSLMAHEATHTVQQRSRPLSSPFLQAIPMDAPWFLAPAPPSDRELIRSAVRNPRRSTIRLITNFSGASEDERLGFIRLLLDQWWVGPVDERALERIWNSFGSGLSDFAGRNHVLWQDCIRRGMDPSNIRAVDYIRNAFEQEVKRVARNYMRTNLRFAINEQERLGIRTPESGGSPTQETEEAIHLVETQELARSAEALLQAKDRMRNIVVGYRPHVEADSPAASGLVREAVCFDPDPLSRPVYSSPFPFFPESDRARHTWEEVNEQWVRADAALAAIVAQSPTVYAALAQDREQLQQLGNHEPEQAQQVAQRVLTNLERNIRESIPKIDSGDLDWRDLRPIHQQLYTGRVQGASQVSWTTPFARSIAEDVISDHETTEFWISLGLGTAAAALFIVAEIASGGLATAALLGGLAVSGGQAIRSWENYEDLATAAGSAASEETQLVSRGQVDSARLQAIIDTIFAFLDIAAPAIRAGRAAYSAARLERALAQRGAAAALEEIGDTASRETAQALQRGITELGVEETMRRTGKSLDEIAALIRGQLDDATENLLLRRLDDARKLALGTAGETSIRTTGTAAETAWMGERNLSQLVESLPGALRSGEISRQFADNLVVEAIERIGPAEVLRRCGGWDDLARALTDNSAAGRRLMQWRNSVFDELERYVREELGGEVQRTGTQRVFSNDIDMSFIGPNSAQVRSQAAEYLARRLGVENSPQAFDRMMLAGLFTDPRRMHAYDTLPSAVREQVARRQAAQEEQLIWNRRVWEAVEAGRNEMADEVRRMMRELNIPEFTYRPLSGGDVARLSRRIDRLHSDLMEAIQRGDMAASQRLAEQIGESQALINAAEGGGYFSAGGVRRYVSERPGEPGFARLPGGASHTVPSAERLTALLDQLPKLDHSLLRLSGGVDEVISGVRGIGKYGERLAEVAGEAGVTRSPSWRRLVRRCRQLKRAADQGGVASRMSSGEAQAVVGEARRQFNQLIVKSSKILANVRAAAQLTDIGNAAMRLQYMTLAHVRLLRATDWVLDNLNIMARAVRLAVNLPELLSEEEQAPWEQGECFPLEEEAPMSIPEE